MVTPRRESRLKLQLLVTLSAVLLFYAYHKVVR